ncbi:ABC transporter permease [soil metagenome]
MLQRGEFRKHRRIIGALIVREMVTRYGREGLGFLWIVGEPLVFCFGVMLLWSLMKPEYEHGIRLAPFVMTGYMCILLFRHTLGACAGALQANVGLLHHRIVRPLHIYISRGILELGGGATAFTVVYVVLLIGGSVSPPHDVLLLYSGYLLLALISLGFSITFSALIIRYEVLDRVLPVVMYIMIPLSGSFVMVDWIPERYRDYYLLNPLPHTIEMVRAGVFGEFVPTHFHPLYALAWGVGLCLVGLLLLSETQKYLDVE